MLSSNIGFLSSQKQVIEVCVKSDHYPTIQKIF